MTRLSALIVGCGALGKKLALRLLCDGWVLRASVRQPAQQQRLAALGIPAFVMDLDQAIEVESSLLQANVIVYLVPPFAGTAVEAQVRITRLCALFSPTARPQHIVFVSTTGVYGDCGGVWINEEQQLNPQAPRAFRRVAAEQALVAAAHTLGFSYCILRVAGIYGPGRLPFARLQQALPVLRRDESPYSNRIHEDDLLEVGVAAMGHTTSSEIFNVADDEPSSMTEYFFKIADLWQMNRPPEISLPEAQTQLSAEMLSYLTESRRIDNSKMKEYLGVCLKYPTLDLGLAACRNVGTTGETD